MASPVVTEIVEQGVCIGCGMCAALCPQQLLKMEWNRYGEYNPISIKDCVKECGLCMKVCPFASGNPDENAIGKELFEGIPEIHHRLETGYYMISFAGYAEKNRLTGSSGGIATWILERLLEEDVVDHVACVALTGDPKKIFSFMIFDTPDEVRTGAGSAYYPVEISEVIRSIIEKPGRYAITGLPCFIKAIRLAQKKNKILQERIIITIGLVCGQLKNRDFTAYIASLAGLKGPITTVRYRNKDPDQPANNFYFSFISREGNESNIFWENAIAEAWTNRWFTPNACNYCDDVFAECADVTCMDAWLPEYFKDGRGTSLVLVRSQAIHDVLTQGQGLHLNPIPIEKIVHSQAGVLEVKQKHLAYRLYLDKKHASSVPRKRVLPKLPMNPFLWQEIVLKERMRSGSRDLWANGEHDSNRVREAMLQDLRLLSFGKNIQRAVTLPVKLTRKILRKMGADKNG